MWNSQLEELKALSWMKVSKYCQGCVSLKSTFVPLRHATLLAPAIVVNP
jgi:hypothetical protein